MPADIAIPLARSWRMRSCGWGSPSWRQRWWPCGATSPPSPAVPRCRILLLARPALTLLPAQPHTSKFRGVGCQSVCCNSHRGLQRVARCTVSSLLERKASGYPRVVSLETWCQRRYFDTLQVQLQAASAMVAQLAGAPASSASSSIAVTSAPAARPQVPHHMSRQNLLPMHIASIASRSTPPQLSSHLATGCNRCATCCRRLLAVTLCTPLSPHPNDQRKALLTVCVHCLQPSGPTQHLYLIGGNNSKDWLDTVDIFTVRTSAAL